MQQVAGAALHYAVERPFLRQGKGRATPLIVFTGRDLTRMDERQLTLGITRHFTKSRASEEELVSSVRDLLNGLLARKAHPS